MTFMTLQKFDFNNKNSVLWVNISEYRAINTCIYDQLAYNMAPGLAYDYVVWYRNSHSLFAADAPLQEICSHNSVFFQKFGARLE